VKKLEDETGEGENAGFGPPRGRKVTLGLRGVSLRLPGEELADDALAESPLPGGAEWQGAPLDGWSADRVERGSLPPPPEAVRGAGSLRPPAPRASSPASRALEPSASPGGEVLRAAGEVGNALELADRPSRPTPALNLVSEMSERFALGDFSGSLRAAELLLGQDPEHELARRYAGESRNKLESLYISRLFAHGRVPRLALRESEIRWLGLDSRMGFLLSRIDGTSDYETLLELSGMPRLEALRCLLELVEAKVVRIV
jgi:hypothetical protein